MLKQPIRTVGRDGTVEYRLPNGKLHRLDGPAYEGADGTKFWYVNGKLHRLNGPACEGADGSKEWCVDGKYHRLDGPACERTDGTKEWFVNDVLVDFWHVWHLADKPTKRKLIRYYSL